MLKITVNSISSKQLAKKSCEIKVKIFILCYTFFTIFVTVINIKYFTFFFIISVNVVQKTKCNLTLSVILRKKYEMQEMDENMILFIMFKPNSYFSNNGLIK
jgi:hypothetical protein